MERLNAKVEPLIVEVTVEYLHSESLSIINP